MMVFFKDYFFMGLVNYVVYCLIYLVWLVDELVVFCFGICLVLDCGCGIG